MQTLAFAALVGGVLWAQTPRVKPIESAPAPQAATPGHASNSPALGQRQERNPRFLLPSNRRLFLPPRMIVEPRGKAAIELRSINPSASGLAMSGLGGACAVPLINVKPKGGSNVDPKIVNPTSQSANIDHMPVAHGLPACAPVADNIGR